MACRSSSKICCSTLSVFVSRVLLSPHLFTDCWHWFFCVWLWPGWPHTSCQCRCHNTGRNLFSFNFLYFQLATSFHSDRGNIISPVAEVAPHGWGRFAWRRGQSARRSWFLHGGDRVGYSGCCRAGWRDEIGELFLPIIKLRNFVLETRHTRHFSFYYSFAVILHYSFLRKRILSFCF